jgi:ankyrin repeat protein
MKKLLSVFCFLVAFSTSANAQNIIDAVENKDYEAVDRLLKAGVDVNVTNQEGHFPLWDAVWNGDTKMVQLLLKNKANAEQKFIGKESKIACLEIAAQEGHFEIVKMLVNAGSEIDERSFRGHTPLRIATRNGHVELVKYFISKKCEIDSQGDDGATPLEVAASKGHLEIVETLVENGANINIQDKEKDFPLGEAARHGFIEVVKYLLSKGADVNLKNQDGNNAEELARLAGQPKIVEMLKKKSKSI